MGFCRAHDIAKFLKAFINRAVDIFAGKLSEAAVNTATSLHPTA